ncbi:MAG: alpha/beta hydrolase [Burkholderiaceae bacterium]|nr:alpha/beta hydrolase [Burkholderiaceae bacterium]
MAESQQHLKQHRELTRQFMQKLKADPRGALADALTAVQRTRSLGRNDPQRADALEMLSHAYLTAEQFDKALPPAAEVVRIRKAARPVDDELLALALDTYATLLFANERSADSDAALGESLAAWRRAYGTNDLRLAPILEGQAEYVQKAFGRPLWAIELLREAVTIRLLNPQSSGGKLAETLSELAIHEMRQAQYGECDGHLAKAQQLIEAEIRTDPAAQELKAGLVQVLVMRAGIAAVLGRKDQALDHVQRARAVVLTDRLRQAESQLLIAESLSSALNLSGDVDGAIEAELQALDVFKTHQDLLESGALDKDLVGDTLTSLGRLYLDRREIGPARQALKAAHSGLGDTPEILFNLSELERQTGNESQALAHYQSALRLRKESAGEVAVMFGTNRAPESGGELGRFGTTVADRVSLGRAAVLVPGAQFSDVGWLRPTRTVPLPVGLATDATRLLIRNKRVLDPVAFGVQTRELMARARLYPKSALVFVHGFNVSFDEAVQRAAQLARDLNYDGAVFVFSWPSQGTVLRYGTDRDIADRAVGRFVEFLGQVEQATGAEKINLIAHSMGNRVLLPALAQIAADPQSKVRPKVREVILAAPAVPQSDFTSWLDTISNQGIRRFTLYASSADKAMWAGWLRERATSLAGYASNGVPLWHPSVQSIDISKASEPGLLQLNHDVFASNPVMSEDIRQVLQQGQKRLPNQRMPLMKVQRSPDEGKTYWSYEPPAAVRR